MRSKAPLALMEQAIMVLVFALAAALCLRAFFWSDVSSSQNEARDMAVLLSQNTAELLKGGSGDMGQRLTDAAQELGGQYEQGLLCVNYDENWASVSTGERYRLEAYGQPSGVPGLCKATVQVTAEKDDGVIFQLLVAWQEVA